MRNKMGIGGSTVHPRFVTIRAMAAASAVLAAGLLLAVPALAGEAIIGVASVIDGDTIEIHSQRLRLFGIDAMESGQLCQKAGKQYLCGKEAAFALAGQIGSQVVRCEQEDIDRYKRVVATCSAGGIDLNQWMVARGTSPCLPPLLRPLRCR
jgi:endonuclease YncB( thermonuclease family)